MAKKMSHEAFGMWSEFPEDGLEYQEKLRAEWQDRARQSVSQDGEITTEMHNPPHPGRVLRSWLEGQKIGDVAKHLGVSREALSRVLNCRGEISAEMSLRLSAALGTSPSLWFEMQRDYTFAQAMRKGIPVIGALKKAVF
jgi:addiction module HigA family antidote